MKFLVVFLLIISLIFCEYENYKVVRVVFNNQKELDDFKFLHPFEFYDVFTFDGNLVVGYNNDIMLKPTQYKLFQVLTKNYQIICNDVSELVGVHKRLVDSVQSADYFDNYHKYDEMKAFANSIVTKYPNITKPIMIGKSIEGKDIFGIQVSVGGSGKKKLVFNGGFHAREWIAPMVIQYLMQKIPEDYGKVPAVTDMLNKFDVVLLPTMNPDGYVYSWSYRLWRKNRNPNSGRSYGVDLNRNFKPGWGGVGASHSESAETYCGKSALSEPEASSFDKFLSSEVVAGLLDFHSYSQLILRPFGYKQTRAKDEAFLAKLGQELADKIYAVDKQKYASQRAIDLYQCGGTILDHIYEVNNVFGYTFELRPLMSSGWGFELPPQYIKPTCYENYEAVKHFAANMQP
jgi:hypothetical protein